MGFFKKLLKTKTDNGTKPESTKLFIAGGLTGCIMAVTKNPFEIYKIVMQSDGIYKNSYQVAKDI